MKKHFMLAMFVSCMVAIFCLVGCGNNNDNDNPTDTDEQPTTIELTLENYKDYFVVNEEITEYNREDYTTQYGFQRAKVNQTTKFSILQLKEDIKFNNVVITIINDTNTHAVSVATGKDVYAWTGNDGKLILAYDGSGSITLRATFDDSTSDLEWWPMKYKIDKIEGSITIK